MAMTLIKGKFYLNGKAVPIEFGNKEQIQLLEKAAALNGDCVAIAIVSLPDGPSTYFHCLCGEIHAPILNKKFTCKCGIKYRCFDTYFLPAVKFAK
jgi:hypothetical protein